MRRVGWLIVAMMGLQLFTQRAALAGIDDRCRKNQSCVRSVEQAERAFTEKDYNAALSQYQAAFESEPNPKLLISIGRCQQLAGHPDDALASYRKFRAAEPLSDAETQQQLDRYIAEAMAARNVQNTNLAAPPKERERPMYKTWWFWTATGLAVSGIVMGLSIGLSAKPKQDLVWLP